VLTARAATVARVDAVAVEGILASRPAGVVGGAAVVALVARLGAVCIAVADRPSTRIPRVLAAAPVLAGVGAVAVEVVVAAAPVRVVGGAAVVALVAGLGAIRVAIIDLVAGVAPMATTRARAVA